MIEYCQNHPETKAISFCHNCNIHFCSKCLNEGKEYYYCNSESCLELFRKELASIEPEPCIIDHYADIGARFFALFIDAIILFGVNSFIAAILQLKIDNIIIDLGSFVIFRHPMFFFSGLLYFILLESSTYQATIGKQMMKIVVVDSDGDRISVVKSFVRNISKVLSAIISFIGFILLINDKKKQALHDKIAKTYMLKLSYELLPKVTNCSYCDNRVELNFKERLERKFICPECKENISPNSEDNPFQQNYQSERNDDHIVNNSSEDVDYDITRYIEIEDSLLSDEERIKVYSNLLGLAGKLTKKDITKIYHSLIEKYHPDKVSHLGEEFQIFAVKKTKDINKAYSFFKKKHNLK